MPPNQKQRKRKQPDEEYSLLANVRAVTASSYYISTHGRDHESSTDEAIIDFLAEIVVITPKISEQVGRRSPAL
jgi:hypothetical protein